MRSDGWVFNSGLEPAFSFVFATFLGLTASYVVSSLYQAWTAFGNVVVEKSIEFWSDVACEAL
jgi:hypothetical protein